MAATLNPVNHAENIMKDVARALIVFEAERVGAMVDDSLSFESNGGMDENSN